MFKISLAVFLSLVTTLNADDLDISIRAFVRGSAFATHRTKFEVEGPENALRVEFHELCLRRALGTTDVPNDLENKLPKHLQELVGERVRITGTSVEPAAIGP